MGDVVTLRGENNVPDFVTRVDISQMNDESLEALISAIRARRMQSFVIYSDTVAKKEEINEAKAKVKVEKECEMIQKVIETIDKNLEKLEERIHKLRGLRLQAGLEIV